MSEEPEDVLIGRARSLAKQLAEAVSELRARKLDVAVEIGDSDEYETNPMRIRVFVSKEL